MKVAVIGLGKMGLGMAVSLKRSGFEVFAHDNQASAQAVAAEHGLQWVPTLAGLAHRAQFFVLSLPTGAIVQRVVGGEAGIASFAPPGTVIVDTSTSDPATSRGLAQQLAHQRIAFIDAPVSGGAKGALAGELTMFIGGSLEGVEAARPVLEALGSKRFHIGESGAGNVGKILNNLLCASHLVIAAEAFKLGEAAGVKALDVLEAINAGSGRSHVTQYNFPARILNEGFDSGFTMQLMRKDVGLATTLMADSGAMLPVAQAIADIWARSSDEVADGEDFNRIVQFSHI